MEEDIDNLERAIREKDPVMKLAQTRLENRTYRPGVELLRDEVPYGLVDEVKQIEASQRALQEKCKQAKYVLLIIFILLSNCSIIRSIKVTKEIPAISILLSKTPLDPDESG